MPVAACIINFDDAGIAQLAERQLPKLNVEGSNPFARSTAEFTGGNRSSAFFLHIAMPGCTILLLVMLHLPARTKASASNITKGTLSKMPIYEFVCEKCDRRFEELFRSALENRRVSCPKCHSRKVRRVLSVFGLSAKRTASTGGGSSCSGCTRTSCKGCQR